MMSLVLPPLPIGVLPNIQEGKTKPLGTNDQDQGVCRLVVPKHVAPSYPSLVRLRVQSGVSASALQER